MLDSVPSSGVVSKISLKVQNGAQSEVISEMPPSSETNEKIAFKDVIKEVIQEDNKKSEDDTLTQVNDEAVSGETPEEIILENSAQVNIIPAVANEVLLTERGKNLPPLNIASTIITNSAKDFILPTTDLKLTSESILESNVEKEFITIPSDGVDITLLKANMSKTDASMIEAVLIQPEAKTDLPNEETLNLKASNTIAFDSNNLSESYSKILPEEKLKSHIDNFNITEKLTEQSEEVAVVKESITKDVKESVTKSTDLKSSDIKTLETPIHSEKTLDSDSTISDLKAAVVKELNADSVTLKAVVSKDSSNQLIPAANNFTAQKTDLNALQNSTEQLKAVYSSTFNVVESSTKGDADQALELSDELLGSDKEETEINSSLLTQNISSKKTIDPMNNPLTLNQNINFLDKQVLNNFNEIMGETDTLQNNSEEKAESITYSSAVSALIQRQDMKILNQSVQDMSSNPTFQKWLESVEHQLSHSMKNGLKEIEIQIDPPHLGKLKIHFTMEGENTNLQMTVYSQAAKETMDLHLQRLRDQMQDLGYRNSNVELSLAHQDQKSSFQQQQSSHAHSAHQNLSDTETQDDLALSDINNSITKSVNLVDLFV